MINNNKIVVDNQDQQAYIQKYNINNINNNNNNNKLTFKNKKTTKTTTTTIIIIRIIITTNNNNNNNNNMIFNNVDSRTIIELLNVTRDFYSAIGVRAKEPAHLTSSSSPGSGAAINRCRLAHLTRTCRGTHKSAMRSASAHDSVTSA